MNDTTEQLTAIPAASPVERFKRLFERVIGKRQYDRLRFLRRHWLPRYLPAYLKRRAELREGRLGRLDDLYIYLTSVCNARCRHCFYIDELGARPDELMLDDYRKLAPTLPPLRQLVLTGGEAILHPQAAEIAQLLAQATRAERVILITNGFLPAKIESLVRRLLGEGMPGVLDILISLDGLEATHNEIRGNPKAWLHANESLGLLASLRREFPGRLEYGVTTIINNRNYTELREIHRHLKHFEGCRHGFEMIRGSKFSAWGVPADIRESFDPAGLALPPEEAFDSILETLRAINREEGLAHHAFHLTAVYSIQMLREHKMIVPCVSAGQNVGVIYSMGDVAMCEFSKPFGNLRDYGMDFERAWTSPEADNRRARLKHCFCTHGCYLSRNIEYSGRGLCDMLTRL